MNNGTQHMSLRVVIDKKAYVVSSVLAVEHAQCTTSSSAVSDDDMHKLPASRDLHTAIYFPDRAATRNGSRLLLVLLLGARIDSQYTPLTSQAAFQDKLRSTLSPCAPRRCRRRSGNAQWMKESAAVTRMMPGAAEVMPELGPVPLL